LDTVDAYHLPTRLVLTLIIVDGLAVLVDGAVEILLLTLDFDVYLVHPPSLA
jgi:hypothetical protein